MHRPQRREGHLCHVFELTPRCAVPGALGHALNDHADEFRDIDGGRMTSWDPWWVAWSAQRRGRRVFNSIPSTNASRQSSRATGSYLFDHTA